MSADERLPVGFEQRGLRAAGPHRLALEHKVGDLAHKLFDAHERVALHGESRHVVSVYRLHQQFVKQWKKVSKPTHNLLG
jgi:hypothetical protein